MRTRLKFRTPNSRGAVMLAVAVSLVSLIAVSGLVMAVTIKDHQKLNKRRREINQAFHKAISGMELVKFWANSSTPFPSLEGVPDNLFDYHEPSPQELMQLQPDGTYKKFEFKLENQFPNLHTFLMNQPGRSFTFTEEMLDEIQAATGMGGGFTSADGWKIGKIRELTIILPGSGLLDPLPTDMEGEGSFALAVECVGQSNDGLERTAFAFLQLSPFFGIQIPAALISFNDASVNGNVRVHWGEAWSKKNFNMLSKSQMNHLIRNSSGFDPWAKYRTESRISFPSNWKWGVQKDLYDPTRDRPGSSPASGDYRDAFYQNATGLPWPQLAESYADFKQFAIENGRYFRSTAGGQVINSSGQVVDILSDFGVPNRDSAPYEFFFIDTIDQQPPRADGTNLASIFVSGDSIGLKGIFYICANFAVTGVGSPPTLANAERADEQVFSLEKIFLDGVLYSAGTVSMHGNAGVFGSVVAQRGFTGSGTPDIYYNYRLLYGIELDHGNLGSRLKTVLQTNYSRSRFGS